MADEPVEKSASPAPGLQRRRLTTNRFSTQDLTPLGARRRSSIDSLREARRSFQDSTDDLLMPKPDLHGHEKSIESSAWDSAPLAFALLPAVGGLIFTNGSSVITDVMLLGLAAIFLNWSVRLPWNWYHSAQSIRKKEEELNDESIYTDESEDDNPLSFSQATLDEVPEEGEPAPKPARRFAAREAATNELYLHEIFALLSCFLFPMLGAYLLHALRTQLTRPSEGLVSNYNLTIFLLASELRPMAHLVKLIQARTLHLQRVVNSNPYTAVNGQGVRDLQELSRRLEELEARQSVAPSPHANPEASLNGKQSALLTTEIRRSLQPELDALNRAVRRYEKRATIQAFQTESRLHELEARLNDAISLAANAARHSGRGFTEIVIEWAATIVVLPVQAFGALVRLPFTTAMTVLNYVRSKVAGRQPTERGRKTANGNGRYPSHGRTGERPNGSRTTKKQSAN